MKSACSKLDLIFNSAVADMKDRLHSFTPLGKTGNSFSAFESWALVTDVALIVSWSNVDL
nr:hypothetical protein [Tanacetum cinerariifolium]